MDLVLYIIDTCWTNRRACRKKKLNNIKEPFFQGKSRSPLGGGVGCVARCGASASACVEGGGAFHGGGGTEARLAALPGPRVSPIAGRFRTPDRRLLAVHGGQQYGERPRGPYPTST